MTDIEFRRARIAFLQQGEISQELVALLRRVVRRLVLFGGLPPMYSPTGRWDSDSEDDTFGDWVAVRLLGTGQLAALLHRCSTPASFSRLAETYLRRHLINGLMRSYATNLYGRVRELLREDPAFVVLVESEREQDVVWRLDEGDRVVPWQGDENHLIALAWGMGEFETIRYRENARKLSPVLERDELLRFVAGLMAAANHGLTLSQIVRVLVRRFDLEPIIEESADEAALEHPSSQDVVEDVHAAQLARAALAELTQRQTAVLREWLRNLSVRDIAVSLHLSVGTVSSEQAAISVVLSRLSDPDGESRASLLNALRDLLFIGDL
jgi:DNA-directed RNA polymerase specialized sigma24 family protein